ncbi:MAG: pyridoxal-phosphate dependent enzyme [Pseudomonadota bacterium]|nr:pyridoxal-phosphate dependent enzyme [Pseudomonadota bacterium]
MDIIDPVFTGSPLLRHTLLDATFGTRVELKLETLNPIRSFKGRGTDFFVSTLPPGQHLVCGSAGNFGQGLAYSAARRGCHVTVYAAENANPIKISAMRELGAEVVLEGRDFDAAKLAARSCALRAGAIFVEDGAVPEIAEGAGTIGLEMVRQGMSAEIVLVPLGNGSLATGVALALSEVSPRTRVIGVTAKEAPSMKLSFERGIPVSTESADTIADGIAIRNPVAIAVADTKRLLDSVIEIEEEAIFDAIRVIYRTIGLIVEPAGAVGVAAILAHRGIFGDASLATVLCGANTDPGVMLHRV